MDLPATKQPSTNLWGSWRMISRSLHVPGSPSSAFTTRYFGLKRKIIFYENEYPFLARKKSFRQFPQNKVEVGNQIHLISKYTTISTNIQYKDIHLDLLRTQIFGCWYMPLSLYSTRDQRLYIHLLTYLLHGAESFLRS